MSTTNPTWEFYYTNNDNPYNKVTLAVKSCKFPKRTGTWKVMQTWFNRGDGILSIGYEKI